MFDLVVEGKIVGIDKIFEAQIGIEDGLVKEIKKQGLKGDNQIVVKNGLVFSGFIDPHVHLREDSSHKWDYKEDFKSGTKAAAHGGVTTVIDMPNNFLPTVTEKRLVDKIKLVKKSVIDVKFHGGVHRDYFNEIIKMADKVVGYKIYLAKTTGNLTLDIFDLEGALTKISETKLPTIFHTEETPEILNQVIKLSGKLNVKSHIAHVSTALMLNAIQNSKLTFEVAPHHILFDESNVKKIKNLTMNPQMKPKSDRMALLNALKNNSVDILATDHAPHTLKDKEEGARGVPNLDVFGNIVAWLIKELKLDLSYVAKLASFNASRLFNLNDRGEIKEGNKANISIIKFENEKINSEEHFTKCGWSPYEGMVFPGRNEITIFNGKIIYKK